MQAPGQIQWNFEENSEEVGEILETFGAETGPIYQNSGENLGEFDINSI